MRFDIAQTLIHFTKDHQGVSALDRFTRIVTERQIVGSTGNIKGGYTCICFSEAPLVTIPYGLVNLTIYSKYSGFGFMFDKASAFRDGARPVIYQPEDERELLDTSIRWRHMRLDLSATSPIDFLWEREWRMHQPTLAIDPTATHLVFPDPQSHTSFVENYHRYHQGQVIAWLNLGNPSTAAQYQSYWLPFRWVCHCLYPCTWSLFNPVLPPLPAPYHGMLPCV